MFSIAFQDSVISGVVVTGVVSHATKAAEGVASWKIN
jgi:hypothetical protein